MASHPPLHYHCLSRMVADAKEKQPFIDGPKFSCGICLFRIYPYYPTKKQHKLVVYNIPKHTAIDIMEGTAYRFIGDSVLLEKNFLQNFHLQPSRVLHGVKMAGILPNTVSSSNLVITGHSSVLLIDNSFVLHPSAARIPVDIIIIRGNPRIYLTQLAAVFNCQQYIFDSSNPLWKIRYWKKDADNLHLRHHSIPEQGAFEMAL